MTNLWKILGLLALFLVLAAGQDKQEGELTDEEAAAELGDETEVQTEADLKAFGVPAAGEAPQKSSVAVQLNVAVSTLVPKPKNCCPRQGFGYPCGVFKQPVPCFYHYYNRQREICCPSGIQTQVRACNCNNCVVLTNTCALPGKCQKLWTLRQMTYKCYNPKFGWITRSFRRRIPTRCYCRTGYYGFIYGTAPSTCDRQPSPFP